MCAGKKKSIDLKLPWQRALRGAAERYYTSKASEQKQGFFS